MVALATRLQIPSIALLLITGVLVGPEVLGLVEPDSLGRGLQMVVGMVVAVILFEGGLTLDIEGARRSPVVIRRMLTIGVLITWLGTALTLWSLLDMAPEMALLAGSLVIVTGPTVISPLLRRIGVRERIKHILYWEAVLVDAIGVFVAVLCLEWLTPDDVYTSTPLLRFGARVALGLVAGLAAGALVAWLLHRHVIPEEQVNIFVLAVALLTYAGCEIVLHESGILSVIVAGLLIGFTRPRYLDQLKRFKLELTELGIGMLFILLAARLELAPFLEYGWHLAGAVAILLLCIRPLNIMVSTWGRRISIQERVFLSWVAPRGIVAAFMASLFALELAQHPQLAKEAAFLKTFTFAVIGTTVILQGFSAPWVARILGLEAAPRRTWLIIGDSPIVGHLVQVLRDSGVSALALLPVEQIEDEAAADGPWYMLHGDPLDRALLDDPRFADVGHVLAMSTNPYFNHLICERWLELVGPHGCHRLAAAAVGDDAQNRRGAIPRAVTSGSSSKYVQAEDSRSARGLIGVPLNIGKLSPEALIQGIDNGALAIKRVDVPPGEGDMLGGDYLIPLFRLGEGGQIDAWDASMAEDASTIVAVQQRIAGLDDLVVDAVVVDEAEPTFASVVTQLLDRAINGHPSLAVGELRDSILAREKDMPTAMGSGIAIPHAYVDWDHDSRCVVANMPAGLDMRTPDGAPIRLVFLVLSPVGRAESHLRSLASIAKLAKDRSYVEVLERQQSSEALLARIHERA